MDWASNLFIVLLITDITGTIFFIAGQLFRRRTGNDIAFRRFQTDVTVLAFLIPFIYGVLYLDKRIGIITSESDLNLFYGTPLTLKLTSVLGRVWLGMFLALLAYKLYRIRRWRRKCKGNIPEEDETVFRVFTEICAEFGIEGRVALCRNDSVDMPCITHYHGFTVILPLRHYTQREAEVIFCHELCHYLNKDLYLKEIGSFMALLHVFNPAVHILMRRMDMLCELYCDRAACKKGKDRFTKQEYFQTILDTLVNDGKRNRDLLFALADDRSDYERRVEYMLNYHVKGGLKRGTAVALGVCFLLGSGITSFAAGDSVVNAYKGVTEATKIEWQMGAEEEEETTMTEIAEAEAAAKAIAEAEGLDPAHVTVMEEGIVQANDDLWWITWTIPAGETYVSTGFKEHIGDKVLAIVVGTPDYIEFKTGIKDPDAIMWYEKGNDKVSFTFEVEIDGRHYFYVTNTSEEEKLHINASIAR